MNKSKSKPLTDSSSIQSLLDDLTMREEQRSIELKKRIDELAQQMANQNVQANGINQIEFGDDVTLTIGNSRNEKHMKSNTDFNSFLKFVQVSFVNENNFGFKDDQGRVIYLQANQDIKFMLTWYFALELSSIQIVAIPDDDIKIAKNRKKSKEIPYKDGCAVFRCEVEGPEKPLMFLVVPPNKNLNDGKSYFQSIFGKINSLMFMDEAEDIITIDSDESWEYCIETGIAMSKTGKYPLLLVQNSN